MAIYTMELRQILKDKDIFKAINYDLYNNDYKEIFEDKFIRRFYFREIGVETVGRFIINLETLLNEIMPYYTHLYKTTTYIYDPIINYDLTETITKELNGEVQGENNVTHENTINLSNRIYDTPIIKTSNQDYYKKSPSLINDSNDLNNTNANSQNKSTNKASETAKRNTKGNIGVMSTQDLIKKEREIIINLDSMLLDELDILFMQVF